jgi:hypothetical protein
VKGDGPKDEGGRSEEWRGKGSLMTAHVSKRKTASVEFGMMLFRNIDNFIERESNRLERCPPH